MKRLVFCFDGTRNKLEPKLATNVVLTAASIEWLDRHGIAQVIHYGEGVGTGALDKIHGDLFGTGLIENVREAYRFLIFNYDPSDETHVFGFFAQGLQRAHIHRLHPAARSASSRLRASGSSPARPGALS